MNLIMAIGGYVMTWESWTLLILSRLSGILSSVVYRAYEEWVIKVGKTRLVHPNGSVKVQRAKVKCHACGEEKQRRIDNACRALRLLRTACVVWPNSTTEVLLAGSFDSWATQRKMEKSSTRVFSMCLQLYPGRYEIKFIVDGTWRIDPLRPIVHNNGYENNLLIITKPSERES